jgi:hypothetical protein
MKDGRRIAARAALAGLMCLCLVLSASPFEGDITQKQEIDPKVLEQIAGDYEFEYQGQFMVFTFTAENGVLRGAPENEEAEELEPMKGRETTFFGYSPDGTEYQFAFKKDAEGKFTVCVCNIPDMGIEVEGTRIK